MLEPLQHHVLAKGGISRNKKRPHRVAGAKAAAVHHETSTDMTSSGTQAPRDNRDGISPHCAAWEVATSDLHAAPLVLLGDKAHAASATLGDIVQRVGIQRAGACLREEPSSASGYSVLQHRPSAFQAAIIVC